MATAKPLFSALFGQYKLEKAQIRNRELGSGTYATVFEVEHIGLKCAGKKFNESLLKQGDSSHYVRRFAEECRLLSQVRHPNIVQFLGVCSQQGGSDSAPVLVMEFLPIKLTTCIEQYYNDPGGILPDEISFSILHDVALGMCYLHNQNPPIVHRNLCSNNVLLTADMTAKISDLGVAKILDGVTGRMTLDLRTVAAYMPPEVMMAEPEYDITIDTFSYGILMIHMFSGVWPKPSVGQTYTDPSTEKLVAVTEVQRRKEFIDAIRDGHPLMKLILKCIDNNTKKRAHANEIVKQLAVVHEKFSAFTNRLDLLTALKKAENKLKEAEDKLKKLQISKSSEPQLVTGKCLINGQLEFTENGNGNGKSE